MRLSACLLLLLLAVACEAPPAPSASTEVVDTGEMPDTDTHQTIEEEEEEEEEKEEEEEEDLYCPEGTAAVMDDLGEPVYCIDRYEASLAGGGGDLGERDQGATYPEPDGSTTAAVQSVAGVVPTTVISWYQAVAVCLNAGKYLCSSEEWRDGCDGVWGEGGQAFPWGEDWSDDACATLTAGGASQPYASLQLTGSLEGCVSPVGAYDLVGNAWEWADPMVTGPDGQPLTDKRGGAYYAGQGSSSCNAVFDEHAPDFTGTISPRCCMTPLLR